MSKLKIHVSKNCQEKVKEKTRCLRIVNHGIYRQLDGRCREAKEIKLVVAALLEKFPSPPPAAAQFLAQRCAFKLVRAAGFEAWVLLGNTPTPGAEAVYLTVSGQIRSDIQTLHILAKDGGPAEKIPSLQEYLEHLKKAGSEGPCES